MISLIFTILLILVAVYLNRFIRKNNIQIYIVAVLIAVVSFIFIESTIFTPIKLGGIGFAFYYVVMLAGALKHKSKLRIKLMSVRMEYSIVGFILITPHAIYQLFEYINGTINIPIIGIIGYAIMIPLFITSFKMIRKKMTYNNWKNLQKLAYIVYLGLSIHLILNSSFPNLAIYIIGFAVYGILKLKYELTKKK